MPDIGKTYILVFIICFWTSLIIVTNYFDIDMQSTDIQTVASQNFESGNIIHGFGLYDYIFATLDQIPVINYFTPIVRIMTFQLTSQIPFYVSLILNIIFVLSCYILYSMIRGTN